MTIDWLIDRMRERSDDIALVRGSDPTSYRELLSSVEKWRSELERQKVAPGTVAFLRGDFTRAAIGLLLALIERRAIIAPITESARAQEEEYRAIAETELVITLDERDEATFEIRAAHAVHPLIAQLRAGANPGLILFSSGSTGKSKGVLHDFSKLLLKFVVKKRRFKTLSFLLLDHIGGINTLLYTLSNGGTLVSVASRDPDVVGQAIQDNKVELLPTSPSFLHLLLIAGTASRFDLSSLQLVTYGTEMMPESTLHRVREILPNVRLQQTYGLTELGILRSSSKNNDSLWVKVGGEEFETKIVNGHLHVRAPSAMLGYLNAPSPFDAEGWMDTGDRVEVDGETGFVRFLGRESDIINVGGQKVYPAEVEDALRNMSNVRDAIVVGEKHVITGQIVIARVTLNEPEDVKVFKARMRSFLGERLAPYKLPVKVEIADREQISPRFKRVRKGF